MSLQKVWLPAGLLVVVGALGCVERPEKTRPEVGRDTAIAEIEKLGGTYVWVEESRDRPIVRVSLFETEVTDAGLKHLKGLANLQSLSLQDTQVSDAGLEHLKGLTRLEGLVLADTQLTDAGLKHLKGLTNLLTLSLGGTHVTDAGLEHLKGLTNLLSLDLGRTQVTDAGINELKKALPNCAIPS